MTLLLKNSSLEVMALRVLLADESSTIKKVIQLALQDFAVEVKSVHSGVDVLDVARSFNPDIILADVLLPKRNGYEVAAMIKQDPQLQNKPVVLMWSSFMDLDEQAYDNCQAEAKIEKPFEVEDLRKIIRNLVPSTQENKIATYLDFPEQITTPFVAEEAQKQRLYEVQPPPLTENAEPMIIAMPPPAPVSAPPSEPLPEIRLEEATSSTWNMDSFEDVANFAQQPSSSEGFEISKLKTSAAPAPRPATPPPADDNDEAWSHQPLSHIKASSPPPSRPSAEEDEEVFDFTGQFELEQDLPEASHTDFDNLSLELENDGDNDLVKSVKIPRLSAERLEEIIRAQSHDMIAAVVQKIVPDLAAELIRKELERLLSEQDPRA